MPNTKIMVVDDDPDILDVVSILLEAKGFEVITYNNADNIIQRVKDSKPAVVLLDIQLGQFDGRDSCKQIKENEDCMHIPVILFSANSHYKSKSAMYLNDDFIEKPFEIKAFIDKIAHYSSLS